MNSKLIKLGISLLLTLIAFLLPHEFFPWDITIVEQRVIALFVFAASMWITEAIPVWTTSVAVVVLMLLIVSGSSLGFLMPDKDASQAVVNCYGKFISYKKIMGSFADPTIMLFMGGFVLAAAASKYKVDATLARVLLKPFGTKSEFVLLGFILITAVFSMFMSNTATAAMMLTILSPVLASLPESGKGRIGLALAIPIAANLGGMGTPIGTPPNAIAIGTLCAQGIHIGFSSWMLVMVPFVIILLMFSWFILKKLFPFSQKNIIIEIPGKTDKSPKAYIVYITSAITILLWMTEKFTGLNANVVALIPFGVFTVTGVFDRKDLQILDWDVLWLVAGGLALGVGLEDSHLATDLIKAIPFGEWNPLVMMIGAGFLCLLMSTFMSNTATAALLIPILAAAGVGMGTSLDGFGGMKALIIGLAMSASLAMSLPISTPPNALAYAKGFIKQSDMAKVGIIVGIVGLILGYFILIFAEQHGLLD